MQKHEYPINHGLRESGLNRNLEEKYRRAIVVLKDIRTILADHKRRHKCVKGKYTISEEDFELLMDCKNLADDFLKNVNGE